MKTNTYVDVLSCSEAFSGNQTGDFSLPVKGLRGFPMMFCGLIDTLIYRKEKLYVASEHQNISNLLFLLLNNFLIAPDSHQEISHCCFFSTTSNLFAYYRVISHNRASYGIGLEVGHVC